jgi:isopentenyl diphosphate isomerase/L-lactate dehydrogenase-like FMN-dependent dehydrogenase
MEAAGGAVQVARVWAALESAGVSVQVNAVVATMVRKMSAGPTGEYSEQGCEQQDAMGAAAGSGASAIGASAGGHRTLNTGAPLADILPPKRPVGQDRVPTSLPPVW